MSGVANTENLAKVLGCGSCALSTSYLDIQLGAPFISFGQGGYFEVGTGSVVEGRSVEEEDPSLGDFERNDVSNPNAFDSDVEMGLEEVPISLAGRDDDEEDQEVSSWEDSCLPIFSKFSGFSVKGHEEEIFNLMNSILERKNNQKGKGAHVPT